MYHFSQAGCGECDEHSHEGFIAVSHAACVVALKLIYWGCNGWCISTLGFSVAWGQLMLTMLFGFWIIAGILRIRKTVFKKQILVV